MDRTRARPTAPARQRGVLLVEALVALLLFSVGVLALVALQTVSLSGARDAGYRAAASNLADQIIGQMWADRTNLASYAHQPASGGTCSFSGAASANANVTGWTAAVQAALPGAAGNQQIVVNGTQVTVSVCWQAPQDKKPHVFTAAAQING